MTATTARPPGPPSTTGTAGPDDATTARPGPPQAANRAAAGNPGRRGRKAADPASARALAMLTRQPIFATPVPMIHVGPRAADGSVRVSDRASDRDYLIYTPRRDSQFRAGYRAGLWYVRTSGDAEPTPRSPGFPDAASAVEALRLPRGRPTPAAAPRPPCRVSWS